jgi:hypothetical protein
MSRLTAKINLNPFGEDKDAYLLVLLVAHALFVGNVGNLVLVGNFDEENDREMNKIYLHCRSLRFIIRRI